MVVPPEMKFVEEASLRPDGMLATETSVSRDTGVRTTVSAQTGEKIVSGMGDMDSETTNALRVYEFLLEPKELLNLRLKAEGNAIIMRVLKPTVVDGMSAAIRKANLPPTGMRRSRLSVRNETPQPYAVRVLLYGSAGHPYRLDIERKR